MNYTAISFRYFNSSTWSVWCWGVYLTVIGTGLILFPSLLLPLFGFDTDASVWARMTGVLSVILGFYYIQSARYQITVLFRWKIIGHVIGIGMMVTLYLSSLAPSALLMTAATDLLAALWTFFALRENMKNA